MIKQEHAHVIGLFCPASITSRTLRTGDQFIDGRLNIASFESNLNPSPVSLT